LPLDRPDVLPKSHGNGARSAEYFQASMAMFAPEAFGEPRAIDEADFTTYTLFMVGDLARHYGYSEFAAHREALAVLRASTGVADDFPAWSVPAKQTPAPRLELTSREREVLALLCERLTNPEIAAGLYIGTRTVEFQVTNLLTKLGVANRRDAAVLAVRAGLL
jgi:DNA-binding CsgD family transcriptional regulator